MKQLSDSLSVRGDHLWMESCDTVELAREFGTPLFVLSETHLRANVRRFQSAFASQWREGPVRIMPAFKACPQLAVRQILSQEGCGCDVFGGGELEGALRGGTEPALISVNGSIKDRATIRRAIELGARIVLDSPREMALCEQEAADAGRPARIMFRLKPFMPDLEITSDFLPGMEIREMTQVIKYGIPTSELLPMGPQAMASPHLQLVGVHVHMGRHSGQLEVWRHWVNGCVQLLLALREQMDGWRPEVIDVGGGIPSAPDRDTDIAVQGAGRATVEEYAQTIAQTLREALQAGGIDPAGITLEVEPGRAIHGDTGIHLTGVQNLKCETMNRPRRWAELDTSEVFLGVPGYNPEPPFDYMFASKAAADKNTVMDLVGVTCNAELLFMQVAAPELERGDVVALLNTGAYIEPMAANFNALSRPGTVLVCGDKAHWIKRPETVEDVYARDMIPDHLAESGE
jgi:diaminopimelate decarboxylase